MSSTGSDDALRIPIEIKTEDSAEIQQMIAELAEAESDIRSVTPRRGRGRGDSSSRSAFTPSSEESGGIFGSMGGEAFKDNIMGGSKQWDSLRPKPYRDTPARLDFNTYS